MHARINIKNRAVKIAKTSFYHFYNSREDYLSELVRFWATEKWEQISQSLNEVISAAKPEAYVAHKQSHIDFYCFLIRSKDHFMNSDAEWSLIAETEKKLNKQLGLYFKVVLKVDNPSSQIASLAYTFLSGWDFLYAFDIYYNKSTRKKALAELSYFLKSQIQDQDLQQVS